MPTEQTTIIEAFIADPAFVDQSRTINGILGGESGKVASLTPKALSYFSEPAFFRDTRLPSSRVINWTPETTPTVVVDEESYEGFVSTINSLPSPVTAGFFKLVDKLLFGFNSAITKEALEAELLNDVDIASIYVPESFSVAATIVAGELFYLSGTRGSVGIPEFAKFSINLQNGSETTTYVITLFASVDAWLRGYDISTIVAVVPPLPYERIYNASLTNTVDNIFSTASLTATLSYNTIHAQLGNVSVSGIMGYNAVLVDIMDNTTSVPFNILFKGRSPTLSEIRAAIKEELLNSGVGDAAGWESRIPGVFVAGRFYIVPFWDMNYTKPDQVLFPSIHDFRSLGDKTNTVLESTGFGDITQYIDIISIFYNKMTAAIVPDLTGIVDINRMHDIVPDYQSFSPDEDNFVYMSPTTQDFARQLGHILAIDSGAAPQGIYIPITENLISFYSFVVNKFELCVVTRASYNAIVESTQ